MRTEFEWTHYEPGEESTVTGDLRVSTPFAVDYLDCERRLYVHLPPSYDD
jgi:hypothetical protein